MGFPLATRGYLSHVYTQGLSRLTHGRPIVFYEIPVKVILADPLTVFLPGPPGTGAIVDVILVGQRLKILNPVVVFYLVQVIYLKTLRDWTLERLIDEPVDFVPPSFPVLCPFRVS